MFNAAYSTQIRTQGWAFACVAAAVYFLAAYLALHLSQGVGGAATIWPASGVFVSAMLMAKPGHSTAIVCAVALASLTANILFGAPLAMAAAFTFANMIEGLLITQLVVRTSGLRQGLDDSRWLAAFFCATFVGSIVSGTIATVLSGNVTLSFFVSWSVTVCLGTLITTPLILAMANRWRSSCTNITRPMALNVLVLLVILAAISFLVLTPANGRFLFLLVIGVVAATYMYGARGAAVSISAIAIIAAFKTDFSGPALVALGVSSDTLFLQFFLLSLLCAAWPLSSLMAEKAKLIEQYAVANELLSMAETTAHVGHWYIGPDNKSLFWSDEVYRIHGTDRNIHPLDKPVDLGKTSSLSLYHPDDRDRVRNVLVSAMESHQQFTYEARIVRPDGTVRYIASRGHPRYAASGEFEGLFGTFQDITAQTETLEALRIARNEAVSEAKSARWLSETDELTGIANRRRALSALREASRFAAVNGHPLTIAIFDVDRFKTVNDRYGHHIGDEVLKRVARIASEQLRSTDLVGRLGGEEFLVILSGQDGQNDYNVIERIRLRIATESWSAAGLPDVTVSAGITTVSCSEKIEDALKRADQALYSAKEDGRNLLRSAA